MIISTGSGWAQSQSGKLQHVIFTCCNLSRIVLAYEVTGTPSSMGVCFQDLYNKHLSVPL